MARIIVCGYMIRNPLAGNVLAFFHYLLGLARLGHRVCYLEESGGWQDPCYDPETRRCGEDPSAGLRTVVNLLSSYSVDIPVCYIHRDTGCTIGLNWTDIKRNLMDADLLLNIGGLCWLPDFRLCRRRALIDMDPFFTQTGRFGGGVLGEHHVFLTYGGNIGRPDCCIPTAGVEWLPTVPPVVADLWENDGVAHDAPFTTIATWDAYGTVSYQGEVYGQKSEEIIRFLELPSRTRWKVELALSGGYDVRERLQGAGWSIRDAGEVSTNVPTYCAYIKNSRGEFSVAKNAYVKTRSGWFSDRSVCYLAAGLPVILQDTGFSDWLPTGRGLLTFSSLEEAVKCIEAVNGEYAAHRQAAREMAEKTFDYRVVLPQLLQKAFQG